MKRFMLSLAWKEVETKFNYLLWNTALPLVYATEGQSVVGTETSQNAVSGFLMVEGMIFLCNELLHSIRRKKERSSGPEPAAFSSGESRNLPMDYLRPQIAFQLTSSWLISLLADQNYIFL
jgi:hypothetical protein